MTKGKSAAHNTEKKEHPEIIFIAFRSTLTHCLKDNFPSRDKDIFLPSSAPLFVPLRCYYDRSTIRHYWASFIRLAVAVIIYSMKCCTVFLKSIK